MALPALSKPPLSLLGIVKIIIGSLGGVLLFCLLIVTNVAQVSTLLLRPISRALYRRTNRFVANLWWALCVIWARHITGIHLELEGDSLPMRENAIIIMNHQSMADVPVLMDLAYTHGALGDMKCFVKDSLKYVPGMGWGMKILEFPFLKRNWESDRGHIGQIFARILADRIPIWMISFVEGTRLRPHKLKRSQEYAQKMGHFVPQNVLIPRTKGFVMTVEQLRAHVTAVYDFTIVYQKGVPALWQFVCGQSPKVVVVAKKFPIETLPKSDEGLSQWLMDLFQKKDQILQQHYQQVDCCAV